jgi:hypothetical protein
MKTRPQMTTLRALLVFACMPAAALAQAPAGEAPPPPPPEAPAQPEAAPPAEAQPAPPAEATPATPSVEDRLTHVEGKLEGMEESSAATNATVDALKRIKVSGYIQGQYEWHDDAGAGLDASFGATKGTNRFRVRRGRLKTLYQGHMAEYMLQIDVTPDGVVIKDAEASLVLDDTVFASPTPYEVKLTIGQLKAPFGYELVQSSGDREMPERSRMLAVLYPGERDRGLRLTAKYGPLRFASAILNGNVFPAVSTFSGISTRVSDPIAGAIDQSSAKDFVGRLGADFEFIVFGASLHYGSTIATTAGKAAAGMAAAVPSSYQRFRRTRVGGDAQAYLDVPMVGGLVLRGEIIYAMDKNRDYAGVTANACRDVKSLGWYATLVQNVGDHFGVVFRMDQFDKNRGVGDSCLMDPATSMIDSVKNAKVDKVTTIGGGAIIHVSHNLKATAIYEHVGEQGALATDNDIFTLRMQAKF